MRRRPEGRAGRGQSARALAFELLLRVEAGAYADAALARRLASSGLSPLDRGLVTRLVYGTLAWQAYLDHVIAAFSHRPPGDLDAPVRAALRLGVYQICELTRIPASAAVNTAVNLVKQHGSGSAAGFVNAVLRRVTAGWRDVPLPAHDADPVHHLAIRYSHPAWLVARWRETLGDSETAELLAANNTPAPTVVRINRRASDAAAVAARLAGAGITATPGTYAASAVAVDHGDTPEKLPGYAEGLLSFQGEASQLVGLLVDPHPGDRVIDACAAPGGKATHLAELMDNRGRVVAIDRNPRGIRQVGRMAQRLGLSIVEPVAADARTWTPADHAGEWDAVLVDAPCSGLGTLRQHPEVKWRRTPAEIRTLAGLQREILSRAASWVRPGGTLVYATCTIAHEENEAQVATFLEGHREFRVDDPRRLLGEHAQLLVGPDGALRTYPHRDGLDGFFALRLKRQHPKGIVTR